LAAVVAAVCPSWQAVAVAGAWCCPSEHLDPDAGVWIGGSNAIAALESGDRVEVQVEDIGVLTNEVVAEPAR
jgi:2-keto-4-pentenoate hydratase/2-oxohepta-3-ene-1,7-dioic acid hydratase in catechol pathway